MVQTNLTSKLLNKKGWLEINIHQQSTKHLKTDQLRVKRFTPVTNTISPRACLNSRRIDECPNNRFKANIGR